MHSWTSWSLPYAPPLVVPMIGYKLSCLAKPNRTGFPPSWNSPMGSPRMTHLGGCFRFWTPTCWSRCASTGFKALRAKYKGWSPLTAKACAARVRQRTLRCTLSVLGRAPTARATGPGANRQEVQRNHGHPQVIGAAQHPRLHCHHRCQGVPEIDLPKHHQCQSRLRLDAQVQPPLPAPPSRFVI